MNRLLRSAVFFLWVSGAVGDTHKTTSQEALSEPTSNTTTTNGPVTAPSVSSGPARVITMSGNATCPSRTVNYITHTLPRQCLRTDRAPYNSNLTSGTNHKGTISSGSEASSTAESIADSTTQTTSTGNGVPAENASTTAEITGQSTSASASSSPASNDGHAGPASTLDEESGSPLDTANFLSFEEWKKQNLAKLGQSPEDVGRVQPVNPNRPRPGINNALESLGEESEIDLEFAGFGGATPSSDGESHVKANPSEAGATASQQVASAVIRSKDAGKTCKERTNYASFDCSATVLKANKECKSASSVLVESKDSYMLNICSAKNKFIIVQLCNDIQVDTVVLANYEFFSGTFRHFRVSVSDRYPVEMEKWKDLGTFEGRNTREIQAFLIENPLIWAKYLRIEFLSHYGTEYYCPVTLLRVHGTTMIEDYRHAEDLARGEQVQVTLEAEAIATPAVAQEPQQSADEVSKESVHALKDEEESAEETEQYSSVSTTLKLDKTVVNNNQESGRHDSDVASVPSSNEISVYELRNMNMTCDNSMMETSTDAQDSPEIKSGPSEVTTTTTTSTPNSSPPSGHSATASDSTNSGADATPTSMSAPLSATAVQVDQSTALESSSQSVTADSVSPVASSISLSNSTYSHAGGNQSSASTNATRNMASTTLSSQAAQPSTQESFFKSFHKRLQQLESNSTLSLKYIEEQSRILRDAFSKVEKRQLSSTTRFLSQLNETVMAELHGFRQAYDQLWQGTVIELEGQRETYQREMLALSSRLTMVADELVWQKRMGVIQSTLLLLCLAMALFGRSTNGYLEVPLMQQIAALKGGWDSPPDSPNSRSPVSLFRRRIWRSKTEPVAETSQLTDSENSRPHTEDGPDVHVQPPSPSYQGLMGNHEEPYDEGDSSPNALRKDQAANGGVVSPKRNRRRPKKPPNLPQGNGRLKSPLAM